MGSEHQYVIASFNAIVSLRRMFERIAFNLNFQYYCEKFKEMSNKPFISFVVPTKNEVEYLPRLLTSINYITQFCKIPIETIVVDYMSTDGTPNVARNMGARVIEVDKPGVGYASYIGTLSARGDVIIRTDADVVITPSAIHEVVRVFTNNLEKLFVTVGHIYYPLDLTTNVMAYLYDCYIRKPYNTTGYFIAFRRSVLEKVNFNPNLRFHDDWDFGRRAFKVFGLKSMHYNPFIAVFVSSRQIKKKGLIRYLSDYLHITKANITSYSQFVA